MHAVVLTIYGSAVLHCIDLHTGDLLKDVSHLHYKMLQTKLSWPYKRMHWLQTPKIWHLQSFIIVREMDLMDKWSRLKDAEHFMMQHLTLCGLGDFNETLDDSWVLFKPITVIDGWDTCCEIALRRMSLDLTDDKSTLVQVMAWCRQAPETMLTQFSVAICSVAHCSRSQDIDLFKFQLSYCYNPFQDTCPITSAVLGRLVRTHVPLIFLDRDKKSYRLSEKCATLHMASPGNNELTDKNSETETSSMYSLPNCSLPSATLGFFKNRLKQIHRTIPVSCSDTFGCKFISSCTSIKSASSGTFI